MHHQNNHRKVIVVATKMSRFLMFITGILFFYVCSYVQSIILKEDCAAFGYNPAVLTCDTCDNMHKILDHSTTYDNCMTCCIKKEEEVYVTAVLEVDKRYLSFMKELSTVVEKKNELGLKIRYRYGNPTLHMYKNKGDSEPTESINVANWEKSTFEDYLSTHLVAKAKSAEKDGEKATKKKKESKADKKTKSKSKD
jgi:hypothetical protein